MDSGGFLGRVCDFYVRHAGLIGALYCIVPTLAGFGVSLAFVPFRDVYLVRLAVALVVGGAVGAAMNRYGASLWLVKHRSPRGPVTVLDGALIGAAVGAGTGFVPPLTYLISSSDYARAQTIIIAVWLGAAAIGVILGVVYAVIGRRHISREWPAGEGQAR